MLRARLPVPLRRGVYPRFYATQPRTSSVSYAAKLMSDPVIEVITIASRVARILVGSALAVGGVTFVAWEGAHQYVEHVAMPRAGAPAPLTEDTYGWGVADQVEHLGVCAHTDARLGVLGRHLVRSAWIAENWGGGIAPAAVFGHAPRGLQVADVPDLSEHRGLALAERFLSSSVQLADARKIRVEELDYTTQPLDATAVNLEAWLASLRAKIGSPGALAHAGLAYEKLYDAYQNQPHARAFRASLATKLALLQARLGHSDQCVAWLDRAWAGPGSTAALVDAALTEPPALAPADARQAVDVLRALSRVSVQTALHTPAPRQGLYGALRIQHAALRLAEREAARPGTGTDAVLQQAWAAERQGELAVHVAETLYALQKQPAEPRGWKHALWAPKEPLLLALPTTAAPTPLGTNEASRAWLTYAAERAAAAHALLASESTASTALAHVRHRLEQAVALVQDDAQRLQTVLEIRSA